MLVYLLVVIWTNRCDGHENGGDAECEGVAGVLTEALNILPQYWGQDRADWASQKSQYQAASH